MTDDKDTRFFTDEMIYKAFHPCWPAGTELVCYCRSTDNRDTIEKIAQRGKWKIVRYVYIDDHPAAQLYKPGQVMFAVRDAVELKHEPKPMDVNVWCSQMLGGYLWSDWDNKDNSCPIRGNSC